jgi:hypothetical protein
MKRILLQFGVCFLLFSGGCSPSRMIAKDECPDLREIKPPAGQSALVIGRTTIFGSAINIDNYVDRKFIGTTRGYGFFTTTVEPGQHYVIADAENFDAVLLNFEPDKTYYLRQEIRMGILSARTKYDIDDSKKMYDEMDGKCKYFVLDPSANVPDLKEDKFNEIIADYKKEHP